MSIDDHGYEDVAEARVSANAQVGRVTVSLPMDRVQLTTLEVDRLISALQRAKRQASMEDMKK